MNLLAKRAGLLLSAAVLIFFVSCEDDSYLLGIKGKTKFKGIYHEIVFDGDKSSVVLLDSVFTDQYTISASPVNPYAYRYLIGYYNDVDFGTVQADLFASFLPNDAPSSPTIMGKDQTGLVLDSATVQLLFDYYVYGPEMAINENVVAYELSDTLTFFERYINTTTVAHKGVPIANLKFKKLSKGVLKSINLTQIKLEEQLDLGSAYRDTLLLHGRLNLDEQEDVSGYEWRLFGYLNSKGDSALIGKYVTDFRVAFPGLAFVSSQSGRILGLNPLNALSKVTIHYHSSTASSLTTALYFTPFPYVGANAFNTITTTRTGALAGISSPKQSYFPYNDPDSPERYIQEGSAVITELDLSDYYSFIDTLEDIVINSAELSLAVKDYPAGMAPVPNLYALLMKKDGNNIIPLDMDIQEDSLKMVEIAGNVFTDLGNFSLSPELSYSSPLTLSYDKNTRKYTGYATMFFQRLFNNKHNPEFNIERIGFYPATAPVLKILTAGASGSPLLTTGTGNSVNRTILDATGIKLKLYYTIPNKPNLE